jgi:hypothetical protein
MAKKVRFRHAPGWGPSLPPEWSQEILTWAEKQRAKPIRDEAIRLVKRPSMKNAAEAMMRAGGGWLAKGHFFRVVHELCLHIDSRPLPYTRSEARAAIKVLEYYKTFESLIPFLRLVAESKGTKTRLHQYECILALEAFFWKVYGKPCNAALRALLKTAYPHLNLSVQDVNRYKTRAQEILCIETRAKTIDLHKARAKRIFGN